jgi:DNA-binding response OmpR family regulator
MSMRILIVEDERKLAQALKQGLENEHYEVKVAETGEEGFFLVHSEKFDLIIVSI